MESSSLAPSSLAQDLHLCSPQYLPYKCISRVSREGRSIGANASELRIQTIGELQRQDTFVVGEGVTDRIVEIANAVAAGKNVYRNDQLCKGVKSGL